VDEVLRRGLRSMTRPADLEFLGGGIEFLEEVAKYRAARRIWAKLMRDKYGAQNPETMKLKIFAYTLGGISSPSSRFNNIAASPSKRSLPCSQGSDHCHLGLRRSVPIPTENRDHARRTQQMWQTKRGVTGTSILAARMPSRRDRCARGEVFQYLDKDREARRRRSLHRKTATITASSANPRYRYQRQIETTSACSSA